MKLKENMKRFWTLSKNRKGFTLVELIVVIAILGILAGVAIPVYNGYIKKAQAAADNELIAAVNTAFAAACMENGYHNALDIASAEFIVNDDGTLGNQTQTLSAGEYTPVYLSSVKLTDNTPVTAAIDASFCFYFEGNEGATLKFYKSLVFVDGSFVGADAAGNVTIEYGGVKISVPKELVDTFNDSGFMADGLGVQGLTTKLDKVTSLASSLFGTSATDGNGAKLMNDLKNSRDFLEYAALAVDVDPTGKSDAELFALLDAEMNSMISESGKNITANEFLANAAVLYASKEAAAMDKTAVLDMLKYDANDANDKTAKDTILGNMTSNKTSDAFAQSAIAYGLFTAFAYNDTYGGEKYQGMNEFEAMNNLNDENFQNYLKSDAAAKDLDGFMAALNMVNSSTTEKDAVSEILINGFDDPNLIAALEQALGK